jgi:hypothetical protein
MIDVAYLLGQTPVPVHEHGGPRLLASDRHCLAV